MKEDITYKKEKPGREAKHLGVQKGASNST